MSELKCAVCGTPLYHINEACPNCLAGSTLVERPPTRWLPPSRPRSCLSQHHCIACTSCFANHCVICSPCQVTGIDNLMMHYPASKMCERCSHCHVSGQPPCPCDCHFKTDKVTS